MVTGKNLTISGILVFIAALGSAIAFSKDILEESWIATEDFVIRREAEQDKQIHKVAGDVLQLKKGQLETSQTLLDGQITAARIKLIEIKKRLASDPDNLSEIEIRQITEDTLRKARNKQRLVECDLQKIERPHLPCFGETQ